MMLFATNKLMASYGLEAVAFLSPTIGAFQYLGAMQMMVALRCYAALVAKVRVRCEADPRGHDLPEPVDAARRRHSRLHGLRAVEEERRHLRPPLRPLVLWLDQGVKSEDTRAKIREQRGPPAVPLRASFLSYLPEVRHNLLRYT